jgi:MFS family permease
MLQAVSKNFTHLAILRAFGGAAEAVADPAFMVISASWYTRKEQPVKIGIWYSANGVGIAFGGLLGYGIGQLKGSLPSWKYEFLIIGALCSAWGVVMFWLLPDSPVTAKNFTIEERRIVVKRLRENQTGVENKQFKPYQIWEAFTDYKMAGFFLIALLQAIVNGGVSNFGTLIIQGFGYSSCKLRHPVMLLIMTDNTTVGTSLLQIPYGALIAIAILSCVFINDRLPPNNRCLMIIVYLLPNIAGAFGMRFVPAHQKVGRLICYYVSISQAILLSFVDTYDSLPALSTPVSSCSCLCRPPTPQATQRKWSPAPSSSSATVLVGVHPQRVLGLH